MVGFGFLLAGCELFRRQVLRGRKQTDAEILSAEIESFEHTDDEGQIGATVLGVSALLYYQMQPLEW